MFHCCSIPIPTTCCERTSNDNLGMYTLSKFPLDISKEITAFSMRSSRFVAIRFPLDILSNECPDLPTLCKHLAIDFGEPICVTRSILPISTPNSRLVLVTTTFMFPSFSLFSTSCLISLDKEP